MRLKVDREADALYLRLDDSPIAESEDMISTSRTKWSTSKILNLSRRALQLNLLTWLCFSLAREVCCYTSPGCFTGQLFLLLFLPSAF